MSGIAGVILILIVLGAVVGGSVAIGAPVLAVPIVATVLVVWGGARLATRRRGAGIGEEDVRGEEIDFTERDRRTLTPSGATPPGGAAAGR